MRLDREHHVAVGVAPEIRARVQRPGVLAHALAAVAAIAAHETAQTGDQTRTTTRALTVGAQAVRVPHQLFVRCRRREHHDALRVCSPSAFSKAASWRNWLSDTRASSAAR